MRTIWVRLGADKSLVLKLTFVTLFLLNHLDYRELRYTKKCLKNFGCIKFSNYKLNLGIWNDLNDLGPSAMKIIEYFSGQRGVSWSQISPSPKNVHLHLTKNCISISLKMSLFNLSTFSRNVSLIIGNWHRLKQLFTMFESYRKQG